MLDNRSDGKWSWSLSMFAGGRDCEDRAANSWPAF